MVKVFIFTNPGFENKGDAAILIGTFKSLKSSLKEIQITLFSSDPEFDSKRCDFDLFVLKSSKFLGRYEKLFFIPQHILASIVYRVFGLRLKWILKRDLWEAFRQADIVLVGLNDCFTLTYGVQPFLFNCYGIFFAWLLGKARILYGGAIGEFHKTAWKPLAKFVLSKLHLITLREEISYNNLKLLNVNNVPSYVTADLGFLIDTAPEKRIKDIMAASGVRGSGNPLVGVSVSRRISHWAFPFITDSEEKYRKFISVMAKVIDYLIESKSANILFVPHSIASGFNLDREDRIAAQDVYQLLKRKENAKVIDIECSPEELKGIIGKCALFVGARTHAVINALSMCVPSVALSYTHKTEGIVGKMLGQEKWVYDIKQLDLDSLVFKIDKAWAARAEIKRDLQSRIEKVKEQAWLNGKLVKELLNSKKSNRARRFS